MEKRKRLEELCVEHRLLSVYLFGSRTDDGMLRIRGEEVEGAGSDLDVGVFGRSGSIDVGRLGELQVALEGVFAPLRVDLVPLDRVDALFQYAAISGERVAAPDTTAADERELEVMRRAADLLPFQRELEKEEFGIATT